MKINRNIIYLSEHLNSSFEINDLNFFAEKFSKVYVITYNQNTKKVGNCDYIFINQKLKFKEKLNLLLLKEILNDLFSSKINFFYFSKYKKQISHFYKCAQISLIIKDLTKSKNLIEDNTILYSFWCGDFNLAASIFKQKNPGYILLSRIHGADLFEERVPYLRRIAFRKFQLKQNSKLFSVSKSGQSYISQKYPVFSKVISTCYLGTKSHSKINIVLDNDYLSVVSCAHIRNIKRIHLIAETLINAKQKIKWYHIGNYNCTDETSLVLNNNLKRLSDNKNVEVIFLGILTQNEIFNFYETTPINCFISLSETEGLPVSMTEAISFGIPILCTDVGGCNEIVNETNGILIEKNTNPEFILKYLVEFKKSNWTSLDKRKKIKTYWAENFNSQKKFEDFLNYNSIANK